ncbi:MAG: hypothetical protein HYR76_09615 [Ignavibacteria bacterium]|nr:hypothetical protein [Ignavibacteria bacterium]
MKHSAMYAVCVSVIPPLSYGETDKELVVDPCKTTADILGPVYRAHAPFRSDVIPPGVNLPILNVSGTIVGKDCRTPLAGAIIEIWHADEKGDYDNDSPAYNYRARWKVDQTGIYAFRTNFPGRYLNGDTYRPRHIHLRVSGKGHRELISQLYFKDDPYIETDPWASRPEAMQRILTLSQVKTDEYSVVFDVHLTA